MNFLFEQFQIALQSESWPERGRRMRLAAWYGVLAATAFVWANALVNVFSFPRLPLGLDWPYTLATWAWLSLALGFAGLIAGWFTEEYQGVVGGGIILTVLLAIVFLFQMQDAPTVQSVLMALPLIGVGMAAAGALRWTARRHVHISLQPSGWLRRKQLAQHLLLIVCIGLFAGILGRLDWPAEQALTNLDTYLREAPSNPQVRMYLPIRQVPSLTEHFGVEYRFYVRRSALAAGSLDLTVRFSDGFVMQCVLPVGNTNFFTDCWEAD